MRVTKNERNIYFDVDNTLVLPTDHVLSPAVAILDPYSREYTYREPHKPHVKLLKNYVARGAQVTVWSKNGYRWVEEVLIALKLDHLDIEVKTKPCVYVDDEVPTKWMGEHLFIPPTDSFGSEG